MLVAAVADPTIFPTPVPGLEGPNWIQIGTESGFLPQPAVIPAHPITWVTDLTLFSAGNVDKHSLLIAPAERADVIVDLSAYAGKTLILYNDAPAAFPARDPRVDYYTGNSDQRAVGGAPSTIAGFGPNTRTMMKITVNAGTGTPFNMTNLTNAFAHQPDTTGTTNGFGVFEESQHPIIVGQGEYNSTYGTVFPTGGTLNGTVQIQDGGITFNALANPKTNATKGSYQNGPQLTMALEGKAIHDEMNAAWDVIYGRMSGNLGLEPARPPAGLGQQLVLYPFINPPTEIFNGIQLPPGVEVTPIASATDGTQIWKIAHNGVDTHPIHFHMADVQLLNRVDWQNLMLKPDANELGWKETIRISPLEDTIVAIRPLVPKLPFGLPDSIRPLNPAMAIGSAALFNSTDAAGNALATPITNQMTNFNWEFVWHCHILSHEEMDMMRPISNIVTGTLPAPPATTYSRNGNVVTLNWVDGTPIPTTNPVSLGLWGNPANEVGFRVQRALVAANGTVGPFSTIFTAPANTTTYTDSTVLTGQSYRYRVIAFNSAGQTNSSIVGGAAPSGLPLSPTGAVATLSAGSSINLTWQDNATNESYFLVQRRVDGGAWTFLAQVPPLNATGTVTYNDKPVAYPHSYQYRVYAVNALGSSTAFALSNIKSPIAPPAAPTALSVAVVNQGGSDQATLTWTDNATNEASFVIQRATDAAFTVGVNYSTVPAKTATPPSTVTAVQTGLLAPGVTYYFRVQATNTSGQSAWSNVFSVVTL
jgi:FtsP/CotA-like multicopper oxidase with cupredoxin domain